MLHLVRIEPGPFLVPCAPLKPRVLEVPLQVPVGHLSLKNQQAAGNGTGESKLT